jgi:hypothetical protein
MTEKHMTTPPDDGKKTPWWWPFTRDVVLFAAGLFGVAYETVFAPSPDPTLLLVFGAMLGLPIFLRKDEG